MHVARPQEDRRAFFFLTAQSPLAPIKVNRALRIGDLGRVFPADCGAARPESIVLTGKAGWVSIIRDAPHGFRLSGV